MVYRSIPACRLFVAGGCSACARAPGRTEGDTIGRPDPLRGRAPRISVGLVVCLMAGCSMASPGESFGRTSASVTWEQCASFGNNNVANDKIAFEYFLGKGLTAVQAAAIVGIFDGEDANNPASKSGTSRGIAQWQVGGRWDTAGVDAKDNVYAYAKSQGRSGEEATLALQLDFVWWELSTYPVFGLAKLQQATTVLDAANAFLSAYEGGGTEGADGPHVCWANYAYQTLGATATGAGGSTGSTVVSGVGGATGSTIVRGAGGSTGSTIVKGAGGSPGSIVVSGAGGATSAGGASGNPSGAMGAGGATAAGGAGPGGAAPGNEGTTVAGGADAAAQAPGTAASETGDSGCSVGARRALPSGAWGGAAGIALLALLRRKRRA